MMAAGRAGELGASVLLLEKNEFLGVKLLITGKGRCNITNKTDDARELVNNYGPNGNFLFSCFSRFGVIDTISFFESRGVPIKVERGNRIFPASDKARDVCDCLIKYMNSFKVEVKKNAVVDRIEKEGDKISKIVLHGGESFQAKNYLLASGGKSYPQTGSTGEGYSWLKNLGHSIEPLRPSLVPINVKEKVVKSLEGLSLKNVEISLYRDGSKFASEFGEAIFTAKGISGPIVLDLSQKIDLTENNGIDILIDFKPALEWKTLDKRVQRDFGEGSNKMFKNILDNLLPQKLIPVIVDLSGIDPEKPVNLISKDERKLLVHLLKEFKLTYAGLAGFDKAIITAGGVKLSEVDPKTMKSKILENLYLAGEVLDLNGPTGGYNLQIAWSTGYVAGSSAVVKQ